MFWGESDPDGNHSSFSNAIDGFAETWAGTLVTGSVVGSGAAQINFRFPTVGNLGRILRLHAVADFFTSGDLVSSIQTELEWVWNNDPAQNISDTQALSTQNTEPTDRARHIMDISSSVVPSDNELFNWTPEYYFDSANETLYPCRLQLTVKKASGNDFYFNLRGIYLLVTFLPYLRVIDDQIEISQQATGQVVDPAEVSLHHGPYIAKHKFFLEEDRNIRFRVFADSSGHRDDVDGLISGTPNGILENPAEIIKHMVDSFGYRPGVAVTPEVSWGTNGFADLQGARADMNTMVSNVAASGESWKCHWLVNKETSIIQSAFALAKECPMVLEQYPGGVIGGWVPIDPDVSVDYEANVFWRNDELVQPYAIKNLSVGLTPIKDVANDLIIRFSYDEVTGKYLRQLTVNHITATEPNQFYGSVPDGVDNFFDSDRALAQVSYLTYGRTFQKQYQFKSIYRWAEAATMRHSILNMYAFQRAMLKIEVEAEFMDLGVPGKVFRLSSDVGERFKMRRPGAAVFRNNNPPYNTFDWSDIRWRVVRAEFGMGDVPSTTVWAIGEI
jgi:hypothetical protein